MSDKPVLLRGGVVYSPADPFATAMVVAHGRGEKIHIYKFKAKTNYRRHTGHRQPYTEVRVTNIVG